MRNDGFRVVNTLWHDICDVDMNELNDFGSMSLGRI